VNQSIYNLVEIYHLDIKLNFLASENKRPSGLVPLTWLNLISKWRKGVFATGTKSIQYKCLMVNIGFILITYLYNRQQLVQDIMLPLKL